MRRIELSTPLLEKEGWREAPGWSCEQPPRLRLGRSLASFARRGVLQLLIASSFLISISVFAADVRPPLVDAAKKGDHETLRALLKQSGVNVNAAEPDGTT